MAEPIALRVYPPDEPAQTLCPPPVQLAHVKARWSDWTGRALPALSTKDIRRDIAILRKSDPEGWGDTLLAIIERLAQRDPNFRRNGALLARIQVMEAAGMWDAIADQRLVTKLASQDDLSGFALWTLARLYRLGIGVDPNPTIAEVYTVTSAQKGYADALLAMAARALSGEVLPDWQMSAQDTVQAAFHSLITPLGPQSCERIKKIVRAYQSGSIVKKDPDLAAEWLAFAAKLGDAQAAWRLYEMHVLSEEIDLDPKVMLAALRQAAEANLPYAQRRLGQVYERGVFVNADVYQALQHYRAAAKSGGRAELIRLAVSLEAQKDPALEGERHATLLALAEVPDAPAWVFTRLARLMQSQHGFWAQRAVDYFEMAAAKGDKDGMAALAELLLARRQAPSDFDRAVALLAELVTVHGSTTAAKDLYHAHLCKAPDAPRLAEAMYWKQQYLEADPPIPVGEFAALQSLAVSGRGSAVAGLVNALAESGALQEAEFWREKLDLSLEETEGSVRTLRDTTEQLTSFEDLLKAAMSADQPQRRVLRDRAIARMSCDYKSTMHLVQTLARLGEFEDVAQFLEVARHLHHDKPWALQDYANALLKYQGLARAQEAKDLLMRAADLGRQEAVPHLIKLLMDADSPVYDPGLAARFRQVDDMPKALP